MKRIFWNILEISSNDVKPTRMECIYNGKSVAEVLVCRNTVFKDKWIVRYNHVEVNLFLEEGADIEEVRNKAICVLKSDCIIPLDMEAQALREATEKEEFIKRFNDLSKRVHTWAVEKGFWEKGKDRNDGEMIALMHSELSECLESLRAEAPPIDKHCPSFYNHEVELADLIIRIMDTAHARGWRVAEAIVAKMNYNESRPYKHGKKF